MKIKNKKQPYIHIYCETTFPSLLLTFQTVRLQLSWRVHTPDGPDQWSAVLVQSGTEVVGTAADV